MVTPLDTRFLGYLQPVFVFLLVYVIFYAILIKTEWLSKEKNINSILSAVVALIFSFNPQLRLIAFQFTSWIPLLLLVLVVTFLIFIFLGVKQDDIVKNVIKSGTFMTVIIATVVILFLIAMTNAFGPFLKVTSGSGFWESTKRVL